MASGALNGSPSPVRTVELSGDRDGLQKTQSGSPDIQIACPLPDIGSLGPTVRYVAASPTKGAPAPDQEQSIAGRRLSGSTRPKAAGDVSGKLPFNA